jgi:putative endonuclease
MAESHELGQSGENKAKALLMSKGYRILQSNWRSGNREIDIIAENKDYIVFVEVKTRTSDSFLHPSRAVTNSKQKGIIFAAETYIKRYNISKESRFDIISIIDDGTTETIEHIEYAFYPTLR